VLGLGLGAVDPSERSRVGVGWIGGFDTNEELGVCHRSEAAQMHC
jgi:hypothetical protein